MAHAGRFSRTSSSPQDSKSLNFAGLQAHIRTFSSGCSGKAPWWPPSTWLRADGSRHSPSPSSMQPSYRRYGISAVPVDVTTSSGGVSAFRDAAVPNETGETASQRAQRTRVDCVPVPTILALREGHVRSQPTLRSSTRGTLLRWRHPLSSRRPPMNSTSTQVKAATRLSQRR
jgi:hypothetical protein